jgi:hypothetical protein
MVSKECINKMLEIGEKLEFINKFFGITPTKRDLERFEKFKAAIKLKFQMPSISYRKIGKLLSVDSKVISNWINLKEIPFLAQMLKIYTLLGEPKPNYKWLSINVGFGQTLDGPWIQVPTVIKDFNDIVNVVDQLKPLPNSINKIRKFFKTSKEKQLKLEVLPIF